MSGSAPESRSLEALVNASGFAFQLGIEHAVRESQDEHGWRVESREYPWTSRGASGFADLVLKREPVYLIVECKRQRESDWVFLFPDAKQLQRTHAVIRWTNTYPHRAPLSEWGTLQVFPASAEPEFCVVRGQTDKDKPLLERIAGEVIDSVEAVANDLLRLNEQSYSTNVVIPVIVTTARLHLCRFDPASVDLASGQLPGGTFEPVDAVRFRKSLAPGQLPKDWERQELSTIRSDGERTVFVVAAPAFTDWLRKFDLLHASSTMPWDNARNRELAGG